MKSIDFTKPGGFPLTQDQLGYLQTAYSEIMPNLIGYRNPGTNVAVRLAGMAITSAGPTTFVSAGWFLYNGALVRFTGSSYSFLLVGHAIYVQITSSATPLTFNDASTPNVIEDVTATTVSLVSTTADSSTVFQLAHLQDFCRETAWSVETFTTFGGSGLSCSGSIKYKKNYLDNTLTIIGNLTTPGAISVGSGYFTDNINEGLLMFTLPSGYIPNSQASFQMDVNPGGYKTSDSSSTYFQIANNIPGTIDTLGNVKIKWFNSIALGGVTTFTFNAVISLD